MTRQCQHTTALLYARLVMRSRNRPALLTHQSCQSDTVRVMAATLAKLTLATNAPHRPEASSGQTSRKWVCNASSFLIKAPMPLSALLSPFSPFATVWYASLSVMSKFAAVQLGVSGRRSGNPMLAKHLVVCRQSAVHNDCVWTV